MSENASPTLPALSLSDESREDRETSIMTKTASLLGLAIGFKKRFSSWYCSDKEIYSSKVLGPCISKQVHLYLRRIPCGNLCITIIFKTNAG